MKETLSELRILAEKKFSKSGEMFFPSRSSVEQATPEAISHYRAQRLNGYVAVDLCCGIGMDVIALAKNCKKVFAVEIDKNILECAKKNAKAYGADNIEFINSNCFGIGLKSLNVDIAFADPSRRTAQGRRVSALEETEPDAKKLILFLTKSGIKNSCIEVSRELSPKEIPFDCEREYVSLGGELNCASLYFGRFKKCERSAVVLPSGERIESNSLQPNPLGECASPKKFLFELDEGIVRAELQSELLEKLGPDISIFSKNFFTSDSMVGSAFFKNSFEVLKEVKEKDLVKELQILGAGKVVLRGAFDPKLQALAKKEIELQLSGGRKLHVFNLKNRLFICSIFNKMPP
ncbi:MAG: methyltransferase domain-containing protein [Candidatus Diapherotrites archaeon]|nr:methyltransferase domain-containing protein [Candidatus Diapherotrites archaeon]